MADSRSGPAPRSLPDRAVTVLDVYGSLLYAGARTLEARLPNPGSATMPVVVLRLRGRTTFGATALAVLRGYAGRLDALGGRLFVSGVDPKVSGLIRRTGRASEEHPFEVVEATPDHRRVHRRGLRPGDGVDRRGSTGRITRIG